jgi:hypothetical protein
MVTSVRLDTTGGAAGAIPMGSCPGGASPQAVVAFTIPGTGPHAITVSTVTAGTDVRFDTVIAVRLGRCLPPTATAEPTHCYDDDAPGRELRSRGTFLAEGGEEVFVIATGYDGAATDRTSEGLAQLDIGVAPARAPTIASATALVTATSVRVAVDAGDLDRDADSLRVTASRPTRTPCRGLSIGPSPAPRRSPSRRPSRSLLRRSRPPQRP